MILHEHEWLAAREAHRATVDTVVAPHRARRERGESHPVLDFLFSYYNHRPGRLRHWHPGVGTTLAGNAAAEYLAVRGYVRNRDGVTVGEEVMRQRADTVDFVHSLLRATGERPAQLGCFGLHEWAMVYRGGRDALRHGDVELRLGHRGTDAVVESMELRCTHHDAFRFFTPQARPRNAVQTTRVTQREHEQPGCLHAAMDLYKWSFKLEPLTPSDLLLRCFSLARDARELDMRASPYDLREHGYEPVAIETARGRAQYVREQAELSRRSAALRQELITVCEQAATSTPRPSSVAARQ